MTMIAMPHSTSGWPDRIARYAGGRAHLFSTTLISVVLSVLAAVLCGVLAPGSHEVLTDIGDMPAWPQDEVRVAAEVWFTIALSVVAVMTTIIWWRPFGSRRAVTAGANPVETARGPIGLGIVTAAAIVQTGLAMLAWHLTVSLRGFADPGEIGSDRIAAPVLSSTTALWVAAASAVLTYLVLVIMAPTSALTRRPAETPASSAEPETPALSAEPDRSDSPA